MNTDRKSTAAAHDILARHLERTGGRKTPERFAILDCMMGLARHFVINDVLEALAARQFAVSRTTIYSAMKLLSDCGLVVGHSFDNTATRYERITPSAGTHQHLVCTRCGKVKDLRLPHEPLDLAEARFTAFRATHYQLTVYGICAACQRRRKPKKKK